MAFTAARTATLLVGLTASLQAQTCTTFSIPGAILTHPTGINNNGDVAGYYLGPYQSGQQTRGGFVRKANGSLELFDGMAFAINDAGTTTGYIMTSSGVETSNFVRDARGNVTLFGGYSALPYILGAYAINNVGEVAGTAITLDCCEPEGFVRDRQGNITTFTPLGSPSGINAKGDIAGNTEFPIYRAYIRYHDGEVLTLADFSHLTAINDAGTAVGNITTPAGWATQGFIRSRSGDMTTFTASVEAGGQTSPSTINNQGSVAGTYSDATGIHWGSFIRDPRGNITRFDCGMPDSINERGDVAGSVVVGTDIIGFVRTSQ